MFFGIELPSGIASELVGWQHVLAANLDDVKWTAGMNLHLTLNFLGDVDQSNLSTAIAAGSAAINKSNRFGFNIAQLGVFPSLQRARVIWAGVKNDEGALQLLKNNLEQCLTMLGFLHNTNRFTPHITLGRLRRPTSMSLPVVADIAGKVLVENIVLYQSILTKNGPIYSKQYVFDLL